MDVRNLWSAANPFWNRDVYIVGLGPSLRVFPIDYLRSRVCILLNDAWKLYPDLGPVILANSPRFLSDIGKIDPFGHHWKVIVKGRTTMPSGNEQPDDGVPFDHPRWYVFSFHPDRSHPLYHHAKTTAFRDPTYWYSSEGGTVAEYAVQAAVWGRARSIFLVGIDCRPLGDDHYAAPIVEAWRTSFAVDKNWKSKRDYGRYLNGLLHLQEKAWEEFRIPIFTLSPFVGFSEIDLQYRRRNQ